MDKSKKRKTPQLLPADWKPNETHRRAGAARGVNVDVAAAAMYGGAVENKKRLANWDRAFGALLNSIADDRSTEEFPWVADYDVVLSDASAQSVDALFAAEAVDAERILDERLEEKAGTAAQATPEPRIAGFSHRVVDSIDWISARLGGLTDTERMEAGRMLTDGTMRPEVWTEIIKMRTYAAAA